MKINHDRNKTKNHGSCNHGIHKLTSFVTSNNLQGIKIILFLCGYKNRPKPTVAFQIT